MQTKPVETLLREKKIYQIVNPKLVQAPPDISIEDALKLMQQNKSGYIVIAKNKKVVGIFTENHVVLNILGHDVDYKRPVSDFMNKEPKVLQMSDEVGTAIDLMGQGDFYHIPLLDEKGNLANVLSVRTLIRFLAEFYPTEIYNLPPRANQIMPTAEGG